RDSASCPLLFSSSYSRPPRHLHSFPTRRSSDLTFPFVHFQSVRLFRHSDLCVRTFQIELFPLLVKHKRLRPDLGYIFIGKLPRLDRKSTRLNSSHVSISYAVFCLKKKNIKFETF